MFQLRKRNLYWKNEHIVRLDDDDLGRTDEEMITAADNGGYGNPKCHFGGSVELLPDDTVRILVYLD